MTSRRHFITGAATMVGAAAVSKAGAASIPEAPAAPSATASTSASAATVPPPPPPNGRPFNPVVTLNGWSLPWRMKDGVKEFHLVAEPVVREIAPGMKANLWGYNGQSPGPTIEVVEGDRVRIFVTNKLPEVTSIHWHGQFLPNGMDGVAGLNQPAIAPGKTYVYEFVARYAGTFMYHPHADEMAQIGMGMMGFWVTHPKDPRQHAVDRDFVFLLNAYDIDPGSYTPNVNEMLDFNIWTINSRVFPGTDPMVVRKDDRVRIRMGNLSMTNHPFHIHGHRFEITGTDGGWIPPAARWPEVTVDIGVGQMRAIEFVADAPGDWAFHCHKSHHTMNAMGHEVPNLIGVDHRGVARQINDLVPGYMVMGDKGGSMGSMKMPLPENTLPMMDGTGPFGPIEMGGMFTMIKVREGLARGDYRDPGWYRHPAGTVAREWTGAAPEPIRASATPAANGEPVATVKRGGGHGGH
jgi:FtsP/CotA-like multicopper oxidase with cupredoxin domain